MSHLQTALDRLYLSYSD